MSVLPGKGRQIPSFFSLISSFLFFSPFAFQNGYGIEAPGSDLDKCLCCAPVHTSRSLGSCGMLSLRLLGAPRLPLQENLPISECPTPTWLLSFQGIPIMVLGGGGELCDLDITAPPKFSWWQPSLFLCLSIFSPKNNTLILVDVVFISLLGVGDGSQVRGELPVRVIVQTEAWTISGYAQGYYLYAGIPSSLQKDNYYHLFLRTINIIVIFQQCEESCSFLKKLCHIN